MTADLTYEGLLRRIEQHVCGERCGEEPRVEWWCPTKQTWVDCPGPCPDGHQHDESRERLVLAHSIVRIEP